MLPTPKIVVVDDDLDDVRAIVDGLIALGTTALGFHYSSDVTTLPVFPCLRILFLDLHLMEGAGSPEQQIKNTIGVLANFLAPENGPYAIVLWSGHVTENFDRFRDEVVRRLPELRLPLPLEIVPLDKIDFITTKEGKRYLEEPEKLKEAIMERIRRCPQLAALLSWEEDVSRAADDAICQIFQIASQRSGKESLALANQLNRVLGELAVASVGRSNAKGNVFRGVNEVLVQVVADRLQHRSASEETSLLWQEAVTEFRDKSELSEEEASLLNRFLHIEGGDLLGKAQPGERGSVISLSGLSDAKFTELWGAERGNLLQQFCLPLEYLDSNKMSAEWVMAQVQPPCDQAQRNPCLLPFILGLRISKVAKTKKIDEIRRTKYLWISPCFRDGEETYRLIFHLRFVAGLYQATQFLNAPVLYRLRDQLMTDLTHELHSYAGRPGVISFPA